MKIHTQLSKKQWLCSMKENMGSFTTFGEERFTGFFFGPVFRVTYHSGYEWNRRITNQKNTAIGFVKKSDTGCEIRYIRTKGLLYPSGLLMYWGIICAIAGITASLSNPQMAGELFLITCAIAFVVMVITAPLTALFEAFTDESEEGRKILLTTMIAPDDPRAYTNHRNEV